MRGEKTHERNRSFFDLSIEKVKAAIIYFKI
jgi:hypothetical protein